MIFWPKVTGPNLTNNQVVGVGMFAIAVIISLLMLPLIFGGPDHPLPDSDGCHLCRRLDRIERRLEVMSHGVAPARRSQSESLMRPSRDGDSGL
jgi:hypothetical protein